MLICVVNRAPLLPIGSLTTCTTISWPSRSSSLIGGTGCGCDGGASSSPAISGVDSEHITSLACRNAAPSRPNPTNAASLPATPRPPRPLQHLPPPTPPHPPP